MVATVFRYAPIAIKAAKVLHHLARLYAESTPQERKDIKDHLLAIVDILKSVAMRNRDSAHPPAVLTLPPADLMEPTPESHEPRRKRFRGQSRQFRRNLNQIVRVVRQYASSLTVEETKQIADHLNEIWNILSQVNRRVRA